jgi:hypothetical protein
MNVTGFLRLLLGSRKVHLQDSLGSKRACEYSGAGFSSQNGNHAWGVYYRRPAFCCAFLCPKDSMRKIFIKKFFLFMVGSVCRVERFTTGPRKSQMMSDQVALLRLQQKQTVQRVEEFIRANWRITIDSEEIALGCSHGLACNIMHDRLKFRKVCARWVPRELKDRGKMNRMGLSLQRLLRYADEGEDMLNRIVTGDESWVHHCKPESKRASVCNGNIPVHLRLRHELGRLNLPCFGILREFCQPIFRSWWKCEFCILLWSSVEASGCNLQTRSRPSGKRGTAMQTHTARATQENLNICLTARTWPLVTFGALKNLLGCKRFADDEEVETEVRKWLRQQYKTLLCCGFRRTGKAMGQVYQCWWRICREIDDFFFQFWI